MTEVPFLYAKKHDLRFYLFSIFTKEDEMARGLDNFNPKEYIISIETNLDIEDSRRDLRSIYDYANEKINGRKFLKCSHLNYKADINQASFIYIGTPEAPEKETFENFINIFDSRPYLNSKLDISPIKRDVQPLSLEDSSYLPYLTALRTKPFMLLAGISGTGKSRIVRKLAQATNTKEYANEEDRWKDNRPDNFQLIQVKPNWHNSMDVVGFLSNIPEPHYVFTDFVRFIVKAWQHPETPYFLCLDEMNLAPVEEYFAEFLSAIESRAWDEDGNYTTDPIISPFKDYGKDVCEAMLKELLGEARHTEANPLAIQFENKGLTLPPNLMVMGTVNMDETTFSFSRKVLDRAMSVEMNEVNYDDFKEGKTELMPLLTDYNDLLVNRPQKAQEVQEEIDSQKVIDYLKAVNELLDGTPFKLGYRAANEAILYVAASQEFAKEAFSIETAMDEFTLMKILSRIEGDDSRLAIDENDERLQKAGLSESPLDNGEQNLTLLNGLRAIVRLHIGINTATEKKINHMYTTLCREHFVSYWA
jgi:MoxR-like ATPase